MLPPYFMYIAALLNLAGCGGYFYATVLGKVQPNRVSWLMWGLISTITTCAQWFGDGGVSTLFVAATALGPLAVFAASFVNGKAYWKTSRIDIVCGVLSSLGLAGWCVTNNPSIAIIFCLLADWCASAPTLRKAWLAPESEHVAVYAMGLASGLVTAAAIPLPMTFNSSAFTVNFLLGNTALCLTVLRPRITRFLCKATS